MSERGLGLRRGPDRRGRDRRRLFRAGPDRRRFDRRRATFRSLVLSALTIIAPQPMNRADFRLTSSHRTAGPRVTVSTDTSVALSPERAYDDLIDEAAEIHRLEPALIRSVIRAESQFNPRAVSRAGAMGLMQLMPAIATELSVTDPFDPRQNIMAGARLLRDLLDRHRGDVRLTLASYNAGPSAVASYGGRVPPFRETREYVKRITTWLEEERAAGSFQSSEKNRDRRAKR